MTTNMQSLTMTRNGVVTSVSQFAELEAGSACLEEWASLPLPGACSDGAVIQTELFQELRLIGDPVCVTLAPVW